MDEFHFAKPSAPSTRRVSVTAATGPRFPSRPQSSAQKLAGLVNEVVSSRRQLLDGLRSASLALEMRQREMAELSHKKEALAKNLASLLQTAKSGKSFASTRLYGEAAVAENVKKVKEAEALLASRKQEVENIRRRINGDRAKRMRNREEVKVKMKAEREKRYADMKKSHEQKIKMVLDEYKRKFFDVRNRRKTKVRSLEADYQKRRSFLENEIFKFKRLARQRSAPSFPARPAAHSHQSSFVLASSLMNKPRASASVASPKMAPSLGSHRAPGSAPAPRPAFLADAASPPVVYDTNSPHAKFISDFRSQLNKASAQKASHPLAERDRSKGGGAAPLPAAAGSSPAPTRQPSSERKSRGILKNPPTAAATGGGEGRALFGQGDSFAPDSFRAGRAGPAPVQASPLQSLRTSLCTSTLATLQGPFVSRWSVTAPAHSPFPPRDQASRVRKVRFQDEVLPEDSPKQWPEEKKDLKRKLYSPASKWFDN